VGENLAVLELRTGAQKALKKNTVQVGERRRWEKKLNYAGDNSWGAPEVMFVDLERGRE